MFTLNFNLTYDTDRLALVNSLLAEAETDPTPDQLTQLADYILLGKQHPPVQRLPEGHTALPKKSSIHAENWASSASKPAIPFDDLPEDFFPDDEPPKDPYTHSRRTINRNNPLHQCIPTMTDLWQEIDRLKQSYAEAKAAQKPTAWKLRRWLIELQQQQYTLLECFLPNIPSYSYYLPKPSPFLPWLDGIELSSGETVFLDITEPLHVQHLITHYSSLVKHAYGHCETDIMSILWDLEQAIDHAHLHPSRMDIVLAKIDHLPTSELCRHLEETYGASYAYSPNYLSTIFTTQICPKIAASALDLQQQFLFSNSPRHWRTCSICGERKILSNYNFSRKHEGYASYCKVCAKQKRKERQLHGRNQN